MCTIGDMGISTHALTWRATAHLALNRYRYSISTHALTWRATSFLPLPKFRARHFYPRPHMEGDQWVCDEVDFRRGFLPTPSHGGRRIVHAVLCPMTTNFYPRPHMEGDCDHAVLVPWINSISTHALTWRATAALPVDFVDLAISTHALTWRATFFKKSKKVYDYISTHALTWRAT